MKLLKYTTEFVSSRPKMIEEGKLYMIPHYNCSVHKCMCGCGEVVVLPIDDGCGYNNGFWGWIYDGTNASIVPSVSNIHFECNSHYTLSSGKVGWKK